MNIVINSILYFFGLGDNPLDKPLHTDAENIASDRKRVGDDLRKAIHAHENTDCDPLYIGKLGTAIGLTIGSIASVAGVLIYAKVNKSKKE